MKVKRKRPAPNACFGYSEPRAEAETIKASPKLKTQAKSPRIENMI